MCVSTDARVRTCVYNGKNAGVIKNFISILFFFIFFFSIQNSVEFEIIVFWGIKQKF